MSETNRSFLIDHKVVEFSLKVLSEIEDDDNMVGELVGLVQAISETSTGNALSNPKPLHATGLSP